MGATSLRLDAFLLAICLVPFLHNAAAIRFVIDREECFSHNVDYQGDTVHVYFVVIKADTPWHYTQDGVDLVVKDPKGDQIHDSCDKTSDKFEFKFKRGASIASASLISHHIMKLWTSMCMLAIFHILISMLKMV